MQKNIENLICIPTSEIFGNLLKYIRFYNSYSQNHFILDIGYRINAQQTPKLKLMALYKNWCHITERLSNTWLHKIFYDLLWRRNNFLYSMNHHRLTRCCQRCEYFLPSSNLRIREYNLCLMPFNKTKLVIILRMGKDAMTHVFRYSIIARVLN